MKCPRCQDKNLTAFSHDLVDFDFCSDGCKGIWCDSGELAIYLELSQDLPSKRKVALEGQASGTCPKCTGKLWQINYFASKPSPPIDVCQDCHGIWLDFKELGELQKLAVNLDQQGKVARTIKHLAEHGYAKLK